MTTIIKLLIAALVVNASGRAGVTAWRYFQFKDAVEQEARFSRGTATQLHQRILEIAEEQGIPLEHQDVTVERRGDLTVVAGAYMDAVPLVPRVYTREQLMDFEVSVRIVRPLTLDDVQ